jgi:hypothetical protein
MSSFLADFVSYRAKFVFATQMTSRCMILPVVLARSSPLRLQANGARIQQGSDEWGKA